MSSTLKCATLRFGIASDMIETPLRSMTNSGIWKPMMAPRSSLSLEPYRRSPILLSRDIKFVRDPHLVFRQTYLLVSMILHLRDPVTCLQDFDVISLTGPSDICSSCGWTNPALDAYASTYSFRKPDRHLYDHPVTV